MDSPLFMRRTSHRHSRLALASPFHESLTSPVLVAFTALATPCLGGTRMISFPRVDTVERRGLHSAMALILTTLLPAATHLEGHRY